MPSPRGGSRMIYGEMDSTYYWLRVIIKTVTAPLPHREGLGESPLLERIPHSEVEAKAVPEFRDVVVTASACVVGRMDADAEVETQNEEL